MTARYGRFRRSNGENYAAAVMFSALLGMVSACSGGQGTPSSSSAGSGSGATGGGTTATGTPGTATGAGTNTSTGTGATTVTCDQAAGAYALSTVSLDASLTPHVVTRGFGANLFAQAPVAVDPNTGTAYVGFTLDAGGGNLSSVIVPATDGAATPTVTVVGAVLGGIAVTNDGFAALVFDPNDTVDDRTWAAVQRFDGSGNAMFDTELFHSANLTDEGTKGFDIKGDTWQPSPCPARRRSSAIGGGVTISTSASSPVVRRSACSVWGTHTREGSSFPFS
jgi:hypothetical protein